MVWGQIAGGLAGGLAAGLGGGGNQGGEMPEWYREFIARQQGRAENIADQPFQGAPQPFAGMQGLNQNLMGLGRQLMGLSGQNMQQGLSFMDRAGWRLRNMGGIGNVLDMTRQVMNPYTEDVINRVGADIKRGRDALIQGEENRRLGAGGTFGSARHGVADSLTNENALRQFANTSAQLRQSGFQNALNTAMQQQGQQFNIANAMAGLGQGRMGLGMQGLGVGGDIANRQQGLADRGAAFRNAEFMRQQLWPAQMFAASGGIPGTAPTSGGGGFNPWAMLGGGLAGAGIGNQLWGGNSGQSNPQWMNQVLGSTGLGNFVNFG